MLSKTNDDIENQNEKSETNRTNKRMLACSSTAGCQLLKTKHVGSVSSVRLKRESPALCLRDLGALQLLLLRKGADSQSCGGFLIEKKALVAVVIVAIDVMS